MSAIFSYTALNKDGRKTAGTLSAESRAAALAEMQRLGLVPVTIDQAKNAAAAKKMEAATAGTLKVSQRAVENFTRELANLLAGGVSLARSLSLLRREASNPAAKQLWSAIHDDVVGGTSLGDAMAKWPRTFSTVYIAMVRAGEAGGFLDVVLNQIAEFRTREQDLRGKVKAAMVYPIILALLAVAVLIFLLTFFIPRFQTIFSQFGGNLPVLTKVIVAASNVVGSRWGIAVAVVVAVAVYAFRRASQTAAGRRRIEVAMLSTPLLGTVIAHFALVRFARMLGTLVGAGVPLINSLRVAREAIGNQTLADTVSKAIDEVQRGASLSQSLTGSPRLFPPSVVEMVSVAEETGRLDKELLRMAVTYEADLDRQLRLLVSTAEPAMLFLMAGLIGTVVIGMLLPVFNLQELIK
ncbi:MAG: type II secretion system F family protein [Phycisphaerae bacterium]|nr:type II secretion system F family protein [Phycisphaerae bacterium]